jgi:structure-specific endonuclease subunit SLX1
MKTKLRKSITIHLTPVELPKLAPDVQTEMRIHFIPEIIRAIPVAYEDCRPYVEKSKTAFEDRHRRACGVCNRDANIEKSLVLLCPVDTCQCVSHMSCLSQKFLAEEGNEDSFIPIDGTCPSCHSPIKWSTMMKELGLRMHGEEEIKAMFKTKRKKKSDGTTESDAAEFLDIDDLDEDLDETWIDDVKEEEKPSE